MIALRFALFLLIAALPASAQEETKAVPGSMDGYKPGVGAWLQYRGDLTNTGVSHSVRPDYANIKQAWKYFAGAALTSTPAFAAGHVIAASEEGVIHSIEGESGRRAWATRCGVGGAGKGFVFSSPMILNGRIYCGSKTGHLYCLDFKTGEILWAYECKDVGQDGKDAKIYASPKGDQRGVIFSTTGGVTYCLDPVSGDLKWQHQLYRETGASAAVLGDRVYVSGKDRKLRELSYADGKEMRSIRLPGTTHATPAIGMGFAYLLTGSRETVAIDLIEGKIAWTGEATSDNKLCAAIAHGNAYFPLGQFVYAMEGTSGRTLWKARADHKTNPICVNGQDIVFSGRDGAIRVHDAKTGKEVKKIMVGEGMVGGPIVVDGTIYVATDVNRGVHVYAFR